MKYFLILITAYGLGFLTSRRYHERRTLRRMIALADKMEAAGE